MRREGEGGGAGVRREEEGGVGMRREEEGGGGRCYTHSTMNFLIFFRGFR